MTTSKNPHQNGTEKESSFSVPLFFYVILRFRRALILQTSYPKQENLVTMDY
ncbi:hypothetical protein [Salipaludibacillus neizhouensis]|uniref:hypothetical protein n=1 Tax=Salipaludibacillus neizhouensis TaxID=885475 RepID=UPI0015FFF19E|nr:hypothetical protein [Salipaludibacillus neizhouensis]